MNQIMKYVLALSLLSFVVTGLVAQDKTNAWYDTHASEILPDAQAAFRECRYDRAAELCRLHYAIVGDSRADALREKALACSKLTIEMDAILSTGQKEAARDKAQAILALNPDDRKAQELGKYDSTKGYENGYEWVDLALPSGLKWASCNVGATSPEEYGSYFAWGETSPKQDYSWTDYRHSPTASTDDRMVFNKYNTKRKYGSVDKRTVLDRADDAARSNWGGNWRMPTDEEMQELLTTCTWTWTIQNNVTGYKVSSKSNGGSIFLPSTGYRSGSGRYNVGYNGYYGTSELHSDLPGYEWILYFESGRYLRDFLARYAGVAVRAVTE